MSEALVDEQSHYEISLTAGQAFAAFVLMLLSLAASFSFGLMIGKGQADDRLVVRHDPAVINEGSPAARKNAGRIVELGVPDGDFQATSTAAPSTITSAPLATSGRTPAPPDGSRVDGQAHLANRPGTDPAQTALLKPDTEAAGHPPVTELRPAAAARSSATPADHANAPGAGEHSIASENAGPSAAHAGGQPSPVLSSATNHGGQAPAMLRSRNDTAHVPATYAQLLSTLDQKTAETLAAKVINGGFTSAYVERGWTAKGTLFRVRVRFDSAAAVRAAEPKLREFSKDVWIVRE